MAPCEQCPPGRSTEYVPGFGYYQQTIDDCKVLPGYGVFSAAADSQDPYNPDPSTVVSSMTAGKCPVGFYNDVGDSPAGSWSENPACIKCPDGQSTSAPGGASCDGECTHALVAYSI